MRALLFLCLFILPCLASGQDAGRAGDPLLEMKNADIAMSALAGREGFARALLSYADEGFVKLNEGHHPSVGKKVFADMTAGKSGTKSLSWYPVGGEVAGSGDLGFTWGNWKLAGKDTTLYGNYISVWKRGPDGAWKLLLDGGNSTPPPSEQPPAGR